MDHTKPELSASLGLTKDEEKAIRMWIATSLVEHTKLSEALEHMSKKYTGNSLIFAVFQLGFAMGKMDSELHRLHKVSAAGGMS